MDAGEGGRVIETADKPKISYGEFRWMQAFEKIKALGEGSNVGGWEIFWIHEDPHWVQLKGKDGKRMVRKGDVLLIELTQ